MAGPSKYLLGVRVDGPAAGKEDLGGVVDRRWVQDAACLDGTLDEARRGEASRLRPNGTKLVEHHDAPIVSALLRHELALHWRKHSIYSSYKTRCNSFQIAMEPDEVWHDPFPRHKIGMQMRAMRPIIADLRGKDTRRDFPPPRGTARACSGELAHPEEKSPSSGSRTRSCVDEQP